MPVIDSCTVTIHNNTSEISVNVITITEDRLENVINKHINKFRKSQDYIGSVALTISLLVVLVTSEFKNKGFDAGTWKGIFISLFAASVVYMVYVFINLYKGRNGREELLAELKKKPD